MSTIYREVNDVLQALEQDLKTLGLWEVEAPPAEHLASQQPFCIDTLTFSQWLQFVFLNRMQALVDEQLPLPAQCGIAPMAEEYFKPMALDASVLIQRLETIDRVLSQQL
ncbi:YqcC family protein [Maricurvus nonylphenolicus]|uniref:YqcC family protein n=1 Tax=Maricurvus nonylphenolicus TaxID=1008307 RepID=UPI0036F1E4E3